MFEDLDTTHSLDYTFTRSSLSCSKSFYFVHIVFAYFTVVSGILAMFTRVHDRLKPAHSWFGKLYILSMLWATASSVVIHNTGLPTGVIYSFALVMIGLTVAWLAINLHIKFPSLRPPPPRRNTSKIVNTLRRLASLKTLHGTLMFVSWINVAGRLFVTKPTNDFVCYTYPAYKPLDSKWHVGSNSTYAPGTGLFVPQDDSNYDRVPWAHRETSWAMTLLFGPIFGALLIGFIFVFFTIKPAQTAAPLDSKEKDPNATQVEPETLQIETK